MSDELPECHVCKKRGQWATVSIGNDRWSLCFDHLQKYKTMVLAWFAARRAS
jgi:hypothetical protein